MSTGQLKQRTAAIISLLALLSALLFGVARYESSLHQNIAHPTHAAIHYVSDDGTDIQSRHP
jgi:hypothetical protein